MIDTIGTVEQCNLFLTNNTISENTSNAAVYIFNASGGSFTDLQAVLESNVITYNGANVLFDTPCTSFTLIATNNNISNSLGAGNPGLIIGPNGIDTATIFIANNQINQNAADGISLICTPCDQLTLTVTDNEISNNQGSGINQFTYPIITNETVTITNNKISGNLNIPDIDNAAGGISPLGFDNMTATITGNSLSNNATGYAFGSSTYIGAIDVGGSGTVNVIVSNNTLGNTNFAFDFRGGYATTSNIFEAFNNTFSNNPGFSGLILNLFPTGSSGTISTTIEGNTAVSNSIGLDIEINPTHLAYSFPTTISDNVAHNNLGMAVNLNVQNGSITASVDNNTLYNNTASPSFQAATSSGSLCLEMSGNSCDTGYSLNKSGGTFSLAPCNASAVNAGAFSFPGSPVTNVEFCPEANPCP